MKYVVAFAVALSIILAMAPPVQSQAEADLERQIEAIFRYEPRIDAGEKYDKKAKLEGLGRTEEVKAILLTMLTRYKYSEPETNFYESIYLSGAAWMLGEMKVKQAETSLSQILFDRRVHENIRALAARSLGQIDPEATKELLLKALANNSDYFAVRVYAAEGLAKTKDQRVLKALEKYSREERDPHVRQQFQKAAQQVRARISG